MNPFKIKYHATTSAAIADKSLDRYSDDYSEALNMAGEMFNEYGNAKMELLLIGPRSFEDNSETVIYRHLVFEAAK